MSTMGSKTERPDRQTATDLRSAVHDLAAAITEPGIGRVERITRARKAAEAARNVADAVHALDPYRDTTDSRLRDLALTEGATTGRYPEAADRLAMHAAARAAAPLQSGYIGPLTGLGQSSPQHQPSPWGGTTIDTSSAGELLFTPWLLEYGVPSEAPSHGSHQIQPEPLENMPEAQVVERPFSLTPVPYEIDGDDIEWVHIGILREISRQLLDWPEAMKETELVFELAVLKLMETRLIAALIADATAAPDFKAAEAAVGLQWPAGTGADLVLTSSADLPKVRRLYAAENLDAALRPRILATAGVPVGSSLVMVSSAVNVKRSEILMYAEKAPSSLRVNVALDMWGAVSLRQRGTVAVVDVNALDSDPVPTPSEPDEEPQP